MFELVGRKGLVPIQYDLREKNMRKAIAILIALCLVFTVFSCSKSSTSATTTTTTTASTTNTTKATSETKEATVTPQKEEVKQETVVATPAVKAEEKKSSQTYKFGMGVVFEDNHTDEQVSYDAIVAAVVTDESGKIVSVKIDDAQNKMNGDAIDLNKEFKSKKELKFDYNMVKYSEATNEWFQQVEAFENYCVGKTGAEVEAIATRVRGNDEPHPGYVVAADEALFASCSIDIVSFKEAVVKACNDDKAEEFTTDKSFTVGLKLESNATGSVLPTEDKDGSINIYANFGAAVVGEDGKILASLTDAIQPKFTVDVDGEITASSYNGTKKELEYDYNMVKYSEATNEWFQQARAFEEYCVGKTADEVLNLPTRVRGNDEPHPGYVVTTDSTLFASCSIQITDFMYVIGTAAKEATPENVKSSASTYKFGMGVVFEDNHTDEQVSYDAIVAAVVTDESGKIVSVKIDDAQNKMNGDAIDLNKEFKSKKELKFDYNMVKYSEATNEWFQQVEAFENYCVGKTGAEVEAIATRVRGNDEPHPGYVVAADEALFASCSIDIVSFKEAVVKACNDDKAEEFTTDKSFTVGLKLESNATGSVLPTEDKDGSINIYANFGAAVVGEDGKILASLTDAIQPKFTVDVDGEITASSYNGTKKELEYDYNMVKYSEATNEWFQQARAFEEYCVGKTADEVLNLPTRVRGNDEPHPGYVVTTDSTLFASCSIQITDFMYVIGTAAKEAN